MWPIVAGMGQKVACILTFDLTFANLSHSFQKRIGRHVFPGGRDLTRAPGQAWPNRGALWTQLRP